MTKNIMTVGCRIPGGYGKYVKIGSQVSLLDADIVLFYPTLQSFSSSQSDHYRGKPSLSDAAALQVEKALQHWRKEVLDYFAAGRTLFVILPDLEEVYVDTGKRQYSGTGRNRQTTIVVRPCSNYELLPAQLFNVIASQGSTMKLHPNSSSLRDYWQQFGAESYYRVYFEKASEIRPFVVTGDGNRVVGGAFFGKSGGTIVALPWMDFLQQQFFSHLKGNVRWTSAAKDWGRNLFEMLVALDSTMRRQSQATQLPQWVLEGQYSTETETELSQKLLRTQSDIVDLERRREDLEVELRNAGWIKALLFEQGRPLEEAVLQAMRLMGFEATNYRDSNSEFDVVLESPEGRCIGEVEGRDNKAIDIGKMRQLAMNIQEDFSREEVQALAKGVLFGNAHRLTAPPERPRAHFTEKCATAAKANGTTLVRTCDLFEVARALVDNPDAAFAAACRQAIFDAGGSEVQFPAHPARLGRQRSERRVPVHDI